MQNFILKNHLNFENKKAKIIGNVIRLFNNKKEIKQFYLFFDVYEIFGFIFSVFCPFFILTIEVYRM